MCYAALMRRWSLLIVGCVLTCLATMASPKDGFAKDPQAPHLKEHGITIDATKLVPASWWQIPGVTPSIWNSDPESLDAPKTSERRELRLKPGTYKFISFTFDFPFTVNVEGTLEFAQSLDQCVEGRGTQTLTIHCSQTYPHGGQRDYQYQ